MRNKQQGSVLIVSLILLLLLTLVGVAGMNMTGLEERMSGNFRDQGMAFQAAEAALVEAENFIENTSFDLNDFYTDPACSTTNCFKSDCTGGSSGGLCFTGTFEAALPDPVDACVVDGSKPWETMARWSIAEQVVEAKAITDVSASAKYIIEFRCYALKDTTNLDPDKTEQSQWHLSFRITALATGGTQDSRVMLQSTYSKQDS